MMTGLAIIIVGVLALAVFSPGFRHLIVALALIAVAIGLANGIPLKEMLEAPLVLQLSHLA
jgi:energy-coupling factor transporter transmembrane protein EcfT